MTSLLVVLLYPGDPAQVAAGSFCSTYRNQDVITRHAANIFSVHVLYEYTLTISDPTCCIRVANA